LSHLDCANGKQKHDEAALLCLIKNITAPDLPVGEGVFGHGAEEKVGRIGRTVRRQEHGPLAVAATSAEQQLMHNRSGQA